MARGESFTRIKFQEKLQIEINQLLRRDFKDPRLQFVTVTHVTLNADYSLAKVYWDTFDAASKDKIDEAMKSISGAMRTKIAQTVNMRHTPILEFIYNSQFEDEARIDRLLRGDRS